MRHLLLAFAFGVVPADIPDLIYGGSTEQLGARLATEAAVLEQGSSEGPAGEQAFLVALLSSRHGLALTQRRERKAALKTCVAITEQTFDAALAPLADALRSSCLGALIALSPVLGGMRYGSTARAAVGDAMDAAGDHPFVQLQKAISDLNTPGTWGGDVAASRARLRALAATVGEAPDAPWGWLLPEVLGHLALAEKKLGHDGDARAVLDRALALRPDYRWLSQVVATVVRR
ncbi:MAG: hypothetical protein AAGE01_12325 [Pseudomonadota bacterium]